MSEEIIVLSMNLSKEQIHCVSPEIVRGAKFIVLSKKKSEEQELQR